MTEKERDLLEMEKDKKWLVKRRVIDENMIRDAVYQDMLYYFEKAHVPEPAKLDLREVSTLILSFKHIDCISNLQGFENLRKLQLDNNLITSIDKSLAHLVGGFWWVARSVGGLDERWRRLLHVQSLRFLFLGGR